MSLSKSKIFLLFCIAFVVGIFAGRFINYQIMAGLAMIFVMVATIFWLNKTVLIFAIAGVVLLLGSVRFIENYRQNDMIQFYGEKVFFEAVVVEEPDIRNDRTYLTLGKIKIEDQEIKSKILATVAHFPKYQYGDRLGLEAQVVEPKEFEDFSYKNYLSRFGIDAVIYNPIISQLKPNQGNPIRAEILKFKQKFTTGLSQMLPEPQNAFLAGILLGAKRAIPEDLMEKFNITGTSHIVALSGYNITIIAYALDLALQRFRKKVSFGLALASIVIFVIATGASASVVRAGIMGGMLLVALNIGRRYAITNALAFTAAIMLLINPQVLLFDIGFQLSFLALIGLVYFTPLLNQWDLKLPQGLKIILLATISAQIFTLPILLINFGRLSLIAPIVNMLVLLAIPITMFFGFSAGIVTLIYPMLAIPFVWISWLLLSYIIKVVEIFSAIPFAAINVPANWFFGVIYYLILLIIILLWKRKLKTPYIS